MEAVPPWRAVFKTPPGREKKRKEKRLFNVQCCAPIGPDIGANGRHLFQAAYAVPTYLQWGSKGRRPLALGEPPEASIFMAGRIMFEYLDVQTAHITGGPHPPTAREKQLVGVQVGDGTFVDV